MNTNTATSPLTSIVDPVIQAEVPETASKSPKKKFIAIAVAVAIIILAGSVFVFKRAPSQSQETPTASNNGTETQTILTPSTKSQLYPEYEAAGITKNGEFDTTDTDSDSLPDWLEAKIGTDPQVFECEEYLNKCGLSTDFVNEKWDRQNVIIVLDSSGSMNASNNGKTRMQIAKEAVLDYAAQFEGSSVDIGLVVYGHKGNNTETGKALSCDGIETIYNPGPFTRSEFNVALSSFQPTGWTPIAGSLKAAQAVLSQTPGATTENSAILLVTDGEETCGGDPVATAAEIKNSGLQVVVDVIALGTDDTTNETLKPIATAGGGKFIAVQDENQLKAKLYEEFKAAQKQTISVISCTSQVIKQWTQCRADIQDKFYTYNSEITKSDPNYTQSGLGAFLISFDKSSTSVHKKFNDQTIEGQKRAADAQKDAAGTYTQNSQNFAP